jgi:undecaprenyl-diphosphatase
MGDTIVAGILGLLEGLTEFIPVSSTGHLLLAGHFLGFQSAGKTFEVVIQLGAILAILTVYFWRLWAVVSTIGKDPASLRFVVAVLIAFLPAVAIGLVAHDYIKTVLFETPALIAVMLIAGGVVLLLVDRHPPKVTQDNAMALPLGTSLKIGLFQCVAMIPGVSRSGATIVGAMLLGVSKRAAAEFSFFLAMPTMLGAFTLDLAKNWDVLDSNAWVQIAVGMTAAFVSALIVVRWLLDYVSRHGFALFAWWRIVVGTAALLGLWAI